MDSAMDISARAPSPSPSSDSDSDSYNTESARIYFGPLKTPERKFAAAAASKRLFPPPSNSSLRRSPRLSSPRPRSATPTDVQPTREDLDDIERVAQLVRESEDEDESMPTSGSGTPQNGEVFVDEPSSALADKVLHALDNPSPPPSPPAALSLFDPYHTTVPEVSTDYQADLMSLTINDKTEEDDENPLYNPPTNFQPSQPPLPSDVPVDLTNEAAAEGNLISFDSFMTPPKQDTASGNVSDPTVTILPSVVLSVDDLLAQSPSPGKILMASQVTIPTVLIQTHEHSAQDAGSPMAVDNANLIDTGIEMLPEFTVGSTSGDLQPQQDILVEDVNQTPTPKLGEAPTTLLTQSLQGNLTDDVDSTQMMGVGEGSTTPLRRSTRPRKSITPNPPAPIAPIPSPPSIARTKVRRKSVAVDPKEEIIADSQDEDEPQPRTTPVAARVRHRSPGKVPLSFQRELGSLSPTSSNVLSTLAFSAGDDSTATDVAAAAPASDLATIEPSQPTLSFSVFVPPETAGPSTPIRNTGPIRFVSPSKAQTSPNKFRIQTPSLNDPTVTPARRIPISEGIAQGYISPEKAAQLGYKPPAAPLAFVPTPARRVFVKDDTQPSTSKSNAPRLASPVRTLPKQRERSAEPPLRLGESIKGKEKAAPVLKRPTTVVAKLPFPLVPSETQTVSVPSVAQALAQDEANKPKSSPLKSNLKQPTSRIPRIGAKPYARSGDTKSTAKATSTTTPRIVDLTKVNSLNYEVFLLTNHFYLSQPPPKPSIVENARRSVRVPDSTKSTVVSSSKTKPATATSATVLKRKREAEKVSPPKPRVVIIRRVPPVVTAAANEPSTSTPTQASIPSAAPSVPAKSKKPSQGPLRIRRVMDPEPPVTRQVTPPPPPVVPPEHEVELPTIVVNPPRAVNGQLAPIKDPSPPQDMEVDELLPSSPPEPASLEPESVPMGENATSETVVVTPTPIVTVTDYSSIDPPTSGLRRTTRSRRTTTTAIDVFGEGNSRSTASSRRKPPAFRSDDVFSGMSITALKDLTTSNTVHNQKYLAAKLETEVVRREGIRPESPAMKVRTVLQRQQDEREKQRAERAQRRSRRSGELLDEDMEGSSDVGYSSLGEEHGADEEQQVKHQRGAGDEEDYVTPERPLKHLKRTRLFGDPEEEEPEPPKRRVKWDRGLFTTVYLDEVQLGSRQTTKENVSLKGILAPTAKALRLDTLGNLPHADTPLTDLVQENITVKKIVYDSDVIEPEIVVKNTRAKKKK
ncbi:hypothetical protein JR316_0003802 [Psilocybe cubensis]|uniref:Uncharacterized protein n=2 Tax=Psilocybe cubensis TaxID=181762 RepID=A0A8H8CNE2_PSICU|nr:hypothetical protein JR316_0003802 [Psilocybe cubensis]KAH9484321.1 hypothetical protein JR316_0003802 [Psilocybe cubensis]